MSTMSDTQPPPPERPGILVRCGLLTPNGDVLGAEKHPDADLLSLIDRFADLKARRNRAWDMAMKYDQKGTRFRKLQAEVASFFDEIEQLEIEIDKSPAKTVIGAVAKISLAMADIDPMGEGSSKRGTIFRLALSALADAKAMLDKHQ